MKRMFILLALLSCLLPQLLTAQSSDRNYVLTRTYTSPTGSSHIDEVCYYDGLGREDQTVLKAFTPGGKDVASGTDYDARKERRKLLSGTVHPNPTRQPPLQRDPLRAFATRTHRIRGGSGSGLAQRGTQRKDGAHGQHRQRTLLSQTLHPHR